MIVRTFQVSADGKPIAWGEDGTIHYAAGYDAERVMAALDAFGAALLERLPLPAESQSACGLYVHLTPPNDSTDDE